MANGTSTTNGTKARKARRGNVISAPKNTSRQVGGGSMSSGMAHKGQVQFQMANNPPKTVPTPQAATQANNTAFPDTDTQPYHQLRGGRQYYLSQNMTVSMQMAAMDYIDPDPVPGSLYGASQNLNHALANGNKLTPQQQYMASMLRSSMHNLGQNLVLTRYDHAGFANGLLAGTGLNMNTASVAQMKKALVGKSFSENKFLSMSYNNFRSAPANNPFTDRQVKITYRAKAGVQAMMPGDTTDKRGNKLSWGEVIGDLGIPQKIVDISEVSPNGARGKGMPSGSKGYRQIEIVIELG